MNNFSETLTKEMRWSVNLSDRLLRSFLRRKQAGALVELAYANPIPYSNLVEAADKGLTDYFLSRADFEGPALKKMGDILSKERRDGRTLKRAQFAENAASLTSEMRSVFEIGPGAGNKILSLLESDFGKEIQNIGFIDKQVAFTDSATRGIKATNPNIHVTQISQDIFQEVGKHKFSSKVLGMVLGGTISNVVIDGYPNEKTEYPGEQFEEMFRILSAYYSEEEGGSLLVSADTSDVQTMLNAYRDRPGTTYNGEFSLNALDLIEQVFEEAYLRAPVDEKHKFIINISSNNPALQDKEKIHFRDIFRPETKYFSKSQLAAHCLVNDYQSSITIGKTKIDLEAGWYNATIISAKPRIDQLIQAAEKTNRFEYVNRTNNSERVGDLNSKECRSVDLLRFKFKSVAETTYSPIVSNPEQKASALYAMSPLSLVRNALSTVAPMSVVFRPCS